MPQRLLVPIVSQNQVAPGYFRLKFASELIANQAKAGQFVHILSRTERVYDPLLRRAFSILNTNHNTFEILYKAVGRGTSEMTLWKPGQMVDLIGPLGQPFDLPVSRKLSQHQAIVGRGTSSEADLDPHILLVGGGVGVPPLAMLAHNNALRISKVLIGARSSIDVMCGEDFTRLGIPIEVATEDGSQGIQGLVTDLLRNHVKNLSSQKAKIFVYSCGPLPMLRAVAKFCLQEHINCQVSLEENMPCGVGICNGCVVPVTELQDDYDRYCRICVDGPVLEAKKIDWSFWEQKQCV